MEVKTLLTIIGKTQLIKYLLYNICCTPYRQPLIYLLYTNILFKLIWDVERDKIKILSTLLIQMNSISNVSKIKWLIMYCTGV